MKYLRYLTFLSILAMLSPLGVFARDNNQHSVDIPSTVQSRRHATGTRKLQGEMARSRTRHTSDLPAGWEDCCNGHGDAEDE